MKTSLFILLILSSAFLSAQNDSPAPSLLKPYCVELSYGMGFYRDSPLSLEEMKKVAPGSELLYRDYSGMDETNLFYTTTGNSFFNAKTHFIPYDKKKGAYSKHSTIYIGFSYGNVQVQGPSYSKNERYPFDTLVASDGTVYYVDSVKSTFAIFNWTEKLIGLDIGQTFHTDDKKIFSCWMGYGLQLGMGVSTRFQGYYSESKYNTLSGSYDPNTNTYTTNTNGGPDSYARSEGKTESIRTKNVFVPRLYFPVGVQIRFSRKENVWNKLALTIESRMNIDVQPTPNSVTLTRFSLNQTAGLKYYFAYNSSK